MSEGQNTNLTDAKAQRGNRRLATGTVTSAKRSKTITVEVKRQYKHPQYGKYLFRSQNCHAHDESNEAQIGDRVEIQETRPLSKQKRWRLVRVVEKSKLPGGK